MDGFLIRTVLPDAYAILTLCVEDRDVVRPSSIRNLQEWCVGVLRAEGMENDSLRFGEEPVTTLEEAFFVGSGPILYEPSWR